MAGGMGMGEEENWFWADHPPTGDDRAARS